MLVIAMLVGVSSLYSSMMKVWQIKLDVECLLLDSKEIQLYGLSWNLCRFRVATTKVTWWRCVVVLSLLSCRVAGFLLSTTCLQHKTAAFVSGRFVFYYFNTTYNLRIFIYTAATFYPYLWFNNIAPKQVLNNEMAAFGLFAGINFVLNQYNDTFPTMLIESGLQW